MSVISPLPPMNADIFTTTDGRHIAIRPISRADVDALRRLHPRLSPLTVYRRFMTSCPLGPSVAMLRYLTEVDHHDREALVAFYGGEIVAVARYHGVGPAEAEVAVIVEDAWQRRGIARELFRRLGALALARGIQAFSGSILAENRPAVELMKSLFPDVHIRIEQGEIQFRLLLDEVVRERLGA